MSFSEWREVKVSEIGKIVTGKTPKTAISENYGGNIPFLTPSDDMNIKKVKSTARTLSEMGLNSVKNCLLPAKSICVSCIGSVLGKVVLTSEPTVTNQQINSIVPDEKFDPDFIYYGMTILGKHLNYLSKTSTAVPIINKTTFSNFSIIVPSIEEQKAIAHILSTLDDKIEVNNQINKTLENMAQAIFKQWFVDFEFPNEDGEPYKSSGGEMVESELGMIPKGWEVGSIYSIADIIYGAPFSSKLFNEDGEGLPLIRIRDLKLGNPQFYTTEEHKKGTIIIPGDILIGMDAEFRPTIWSGKKAYLNQRVCQIKSNKDYIHDYYLYELIKPHMQFFEFSKVGTTVIHLGKSDIDSIKVIIPNTNYLESFSNIVAPLHDKLVSLSIENRKLRKIRDVLLPKLMSGEIRVPLDEEGDVS